MRNGDNFDIYLLLRLARRNKTIFGTHPVEASIWGVFYLSRGCLPNAEAAFYFSGSTETTNSQSSHEYAGFFQFWHGRLCLFHLTPAERAQYPSEGKILRSGKFPRVFACDTLTVARTIIDAVSLKMCPLGLEAALLLDTQRSFLCVLSISALLFL